MKILHRRTLLEFDKIEIFEGIDTDGTQYLGLLVDSTDTKDVYCVIPISSDVLKKFEDGESELLHVFQNRLKNQWFLCETSDVTHDPIELIDQGNVAIDGKYLPKSGFYLSSETDDTHHEIIESKIGNKKLHFNDNLMYFVLGVVVSVIVTIFLTFDNPVKDYFDRTFSKSCEGIQNVMFESCHNNNQLPSIKISWSKVFKAKFYKIFRKQIGIEYNSNDQKQNDLLNYIDLSEQSQTHQFYSHPFRFITQNLFQEQIKLGLYAYKIQAFEGPGVLLDEKEFVWHHRLKVKVADQVNVRYKAFYDANNPDDGRCKIGDDFVLVNIGDTGFAYSGPEIVKNNMPSSSITWWNVVWDKKNDDDPSVIGWSAESDSSKKYLELQNIKGRPWQYDKF